MLYERWREISGEHAGELALVEAGSGRRWSFAELAAAAERTSLPEGLICPRGNSAEMILQTLAAWRTGRICCPLEQAQPTPAVPNFPTGCAHLKITSATSGPPKLIAFTGEQLFADAQNIVRSMGLRPDWPNLAAISLAHSYGFSNLVLPLLLFGIPLVLAPAPLPEVVRRAAELAPQVTLAAVPALWRMWHEGGGFPPNVGLAISAGAPLPIALEGEVLSKRGVKIHNFYGSSECGGIAYDRSDTVRPDPSCAGTPMDGVQLTVAPSGTLVVKSEAVGLGYWPDPAPNLGSGRFETSDLAEIRDGQVFLKGRAGDVINVAGRKVAPETVEAALSAHPMVRECVVFGVPDSGEGRYERIVACAALREKLDVGALGKFLSERLPAWQIPREWWFVETLSVNQRGKISRAEWRAKYIARAGNAAPSTGSPVRTESRPTHGTFLKDRPPAGSGYDRTRSAPAR